MLTEYEAKRDFSRTPEPLPGLKGADGPLIFVVHKHAARRLHYDFRLEVDGMLKSWAVPGGPSLDPEQKRLAVMVEDHPLDYRSFEGVIPEGEYGAGQVIVWDTGTYSPEENGRAYFDDRAQAEMRMRESLGQGKISISLRGYKLKGNWTLVKMRRSRNNWLLIKHRDAFAEADRDILADGSSVLSRLSIEDLKAGRLTDPSAVSLEKMPGAIQSTFPVSVAPMLATPASAPFSDAGWLFEPKLDGFRTITLIREGNVRLLSRRGLDVTAQFPDIADDLRHQPGDMILDGEIVALDREGRPCFQCLQQRLKSEPKSQVPIIYYVFDTLYLGGYDLGKVPLWQRKDILKRTLHPSDRIRLIEYFEKDGEAVYEAAISQGLEGIIAKRHDSIYEPGRRSQSWLKIKASRSDEFVVGGYSQGSGSRDQTFGALLLGYYDDADRLVYAGHVGSGFDETTLTELRKRLDAIRIDQCPFTEMPPLNAPTTWVRPEIVMEVKFSQRTQSGYLRAPVFLRPREDKPAAEIRRIEIVPAPVSTKTFRPRDPLEIVRGSVEEQLGSPADQLILNVQGHKIAVNNLNKELWHPIPGRRALTKRALILYLVKVAPYLLPHLQDRPLTLSRYPDGIYGEHFYQKHWSYPLPDFVQTVRLLSEEGWPEHLVSNNLATLVWLGQLTDIELHTWFSRISPDPDLREQPEKGDDDFLSRHPDFIIFDIDPYIYSKKEPEGAEPELNRPAFARTVEVARWLKDILDRLSLSSFVKTSGRTGLHVYVPIVRRFDYTTVRSAAETIARFLLQEYPQEITTEWAVERRTGKVFLDHNQNTRGKTLASVYSPRPTPEATVSTPLRWEELDRIYPTDFTILTVPHRLAEVGDLWAGILDAKRDLESVLNLK